jgi:hypothetical protein
MSHRSTILLPLAVAALLPALLVLAGCGTDSSRVLARVGESHAHRRRLHRCRAREGEPSGAAGQREGPDAGRHGAGASLVLSDAERLGLYREPAVAESRARIERTRRRPSTAD